MRDRRRDWFIRWSWALADVGIWIVCVLASAWIRYDFSIAQATTRPFIVFASIAIGTHLLLGIIIGPYGVGHQRGSFEEAADLAGAVFGTTIVLMLAVFAFELGPIPRSVPFTAPAFALLAMFATRFIVRALRTAYRGGSAEDEPVIIFGAGEAGRRLTRSLIRDVDSGFRPVALLDDDPAKGRLRIEGVRVRGARQDIADVADRTGATTLVIALPVAQAATIRQITDLAKDAGLEVKTLPPVREIIDGQPTAGHLRDVNVADLLGRRPITLDTTLIADHIAGKSILVTGAGGSIGSELSRQIARFGPARIYLLDRDESGLQATQLSLYGNGLLDSQDIVLADIRDRAALDEAFAVAHPDIVFHAAALKHLPLLEAYPLEAWKSNVLGTLNVLDAAAAAGVGTFVNISTDKAADPTSVLGYSKRLGERLTAHFSGRFPGRFVSVRFGNVLGSRGSVVHAFTAQIERGGPITVTHPDVKRYFMLIPEACQLVLEAAALGEDGEVMVLDMGEQVKIVDVARTLIKMSGRRDIETVFTGLRPGEKLGEELFSDIEQPAPTAHRLVNRVGVPPLAPDVVTAVRFADESEGRLWMQTEATVRSANDPSTP